jgi:hypothetical protein
MVKAAAQVVETRLLAPTEEVDESPQLLYRRIDKQLTPQTIPWEVDYVYVTPGQAKELLAHAEEDPQFRQRKRTPVRIKRWRELIQTGRFVSFLPDGPLCINAENYLRNGGNRLTGLSELEGEIDPATGEEYQVGFMVIRGCPDWMFKHFDQGNVRSLRESMFINRRDMNTFTAPTVRLGMRYEEFILGKRRPTGWVQWGKHRDENPDIDDWMDRREYVLDFIQQGNVLRKATELQVPSGAIFLAFQHMAWPDGSDEIQSYLDALIQGEMLRKGNPALTLREWSRRDGYIGAATAGRREGHLLLLFKMFQAFQRGVQIDTILVGKGFPMHMPYHPDGPEKAVENVTLALARLDKEAIKK